MANISAALAKGYLDWALGGASATQATARWAGLAVGAPTSVAASELVAASGYTRVTALFSAAASPAGSASNTAAMTFGPFSSANIPITGLVLFNGPTVGADAMLWYGNLATARVAQVGDSLVVAAGALVITIA